MRYTADQKEEARTRLLEAAGRAFRRQGYGGIGVDGLAKEAGMTSGAFYGYFKSKDVAFAEVAVAGLEQLDAAVAQLQADHPVDWAVRFIDFYLSERVTCDLSQSCALQSLTPDVMRANGATKSRFAGVLKRVTERIASGLEGVEPEIRKDRATALLALLSGGVTIARSVGDPSSSSGIVESLRLAARLICDRQS